MGEAGAVRPLDAAVLAHVPGADVRRRAAADLGAEFDRLACRGIRRREVEVHYRWLLAGQQAVAENDRVLFTVESLDGYFHCVRYRNLLLAIHDDDGLLPLGGKGILGNTVRPSGRRELLRRSKESVCHTRALVGYGDRPATAGATLIDTVVDLPGGSDALVQARNRTDRRLVLIPLAVLVEVMELLHIEEGLELPHLEVVSLYLTPRRPKPVVSLKADLHGVRAVTVVGRAAVTIAGRFRYRVQVAAVGQIGVDWHDPGLVDTAVVGRIKERHKLDDYGVVAGRRGAAVVGIGISVVLLADAGGAVRGIGNVAGIVGVRLRMISGGCDCAVRIQREIQPGDDNAALQAHRTALGGVLRKKYRAVGVRHLENEIAVGKACGVARGVGSGATVEIDLALGGVADILVDDAAIGSGREDGACQGGGRS